MLVPSGRPDNILDAIKRGFNGRTIWAKATTDADAYYQQMAAKYHYIAELPNGFVLTELGERETAQGSSISKQPISR